MNVSGSSVHVESPEPAQHGGPAHVVRTRGLDIKCKG